MKKKLLALALVLAMLLSVLPAGALAAQSYTDVALTFRDASNGFIFDVETSADLIGLYGTWKNLYMTAQCRYSTSSGEDAFAAEPKDVQVRFNVDESGRLHLYDAKEYQGVKLVIPAGTVVTPGDTALSDVQLRITNEIVLERAPAYWGTTSGWLGQAQQAAPLPIELTFSQTDSNGHWIFGYNKALSKGWYRTEAVMDGVDTVVMMEYNGTQLYIYANTFRPDKLAEMKTPDASFVIPQGATMIPVTSFDQSTMVNGAQPYQVATQLQVLKTDGTWVVDENCRIAALSYEQGKITGQYTSVQRAVAGTQGTDQYVKLVADSEETVYISKDLHLDLNGYELRNAVVSQNATLYAMDTVTDGYSSAVSYGIIGKITGSYATTHRTNVDGTYKRYAAITDSNGTSFHRFYVGITDINVDTGSAGVGYTLTIAGDGNVLAALTAEDSFGIQISAKDESGNQIAGFRRTMSGTASQLQEGINTKKLVMSNVLAEDGQESAVCGKYVICAEAYLNFETEKVSSVEERSVQQMIECLNDYFDGFTEAQKHAVKAMLIRCGIDTLDWDTDKILNWNAVSPLRLIQGGTSSYCIVVAEDANDNELLAAEELQNYVNRSTGVSLEIITESEALTGGEYIYIGATEAADCAGVAPTFEQTKYNGFRMARIGNALYLRGHSSIGTRNSVYEFLNRFFDYEYYALDELYIAQKEDVTLWTLDEVVNPSFDWRTAVYGWAVWDEYAAHRLRVNQGPEIYINGWDCHYSYNIVSPVTYDYTSDKYKDWFAPKVVGPSGGPYEPVQLCYSNEEMHETYIANLLKIIEKSDQPYIILGQEDHPWWCQCSDCKVWKATYGTDAAVMIVFMNKVQAAVDAWFAENRPGEKPTMCLMFAYYDTVVPPANWNAKTGKWEPIDGTMVLNPNSGILFAPIDMECDVAFSDYDPTDKTNIHGQLLGWKACADTIFAWTYSQNFYEFFLPYNTFDTVRENYQLLLDHGCVSILDQTQSNSQGYMTGWNLAKAYLLSKLQWDNTQTTEAVLKQFFTQYYGSASNVMYSLFRDEMNWMNYVYSDLGAQGGIYEELMLQKYWPEDLLQSYLDRIDLAYEAIKPLRQTNIQLYAKIYNRIQVESLQFRYLMIQLHPEHYDEQTLLKEKQKFRTFCENQGVTNYSLYASIDDLWEAWGIA